MKSRIIFNTTVINSQLCLISPANKSGAKITNFFITYYSNFKPSDLAAGLGFEPRYLASKANVLPLDDPGILNKLTAGKRLVAYEPYWYEHTRYTRKYRRMASALVEIVRRSTAPNWAPNSTTILERR